MRKAFLLTLGFVTCALQAALGSGASLNFHFYAGGNPPCSEGADGDVGQGGLIVHVGAPPPAYTYYAFDAYDPTGAYAGQVAWQVASDGSMHNLDASSVVDHTVVSAPSAIGPFGVWTFSNPQSSDPNEISSMSADSLVVAYGTDCSGLVGAVINMTIDVYTGGASPIELPPDENQTEECHANTGCSSCPKGPMAKYSIHLMLASLHIEDTPISYNCPVGPSPQFKVVYNQREAQPASLDYGNLGPKWTFNWLSYITDNPANPAANVSLYVRGGGTEVYSGYNSTTHSYAADKQSLAVLIRSPDSSFYERRFPDGSKEVFSVNDGSTSYPRRFFLSSVVDAAGNAVNLTYEGLKITAINDSVGNPPTTLAYDLTEDPLRITKVTDPFGRFAQFEYNGDGGQLSKITDPIGIESEFFYEQGTHFVNKLRTHYGDTHFEKGEKGNSVRWLEATDPLGGKERVEYNTSVSSIPPSESIAPSGVYNANINRRNTFYWDKKAMADAPGDYTSARIIHWLASTDNGKVSGIKHSEKLARENRVWYNYADQSNGGTAGTNALPIRTARVLDNGTTQRSQFEYNTVGNRTKYTDAKNRVTNYQYAENGIDLLNVYQQTSGGSDKIAAYTYDPADPPHLPHTYTDAAGQPTTYTYNSYGQTTDVENARGETTHYGYGNGKDGYPIGYLTSITSPEFNGQNAVTNFTYETTQDTANPANRVRTVTSNPDGYTVTTTYDALDRPTQITFPDQTTQQFQYEQDFGQGVRPILDLTSSKDRRDRWTIRHYNGNRQMDSVAEPFGNNSTRLTQFDWCTCGSLVGITDGNQNVTTFNRDLQSRVTSKVFASGVASRILYTYENTTSRLESMTDALNQTTNYQYDVDDNLSQVSYTGAQNPTPTVIYTYEDYYDRVHSVATAGLGALIYTYYPVTTSGTLGANRVETVHTVKGLFSDDTITYTYDELGRVLSQDINGTTASLTYDSLGRLGATANALGSFTRAYESDVTPRLKTLTYPYGQTANYDYFGNDHDRQLQTLRNLAAGSVNLSRFDYTYDAEGEILSLNKLLGSSASGLWFDYDDARQLKVVSNAASSNIVTYENAFDYDLAGNRVGDSVSNPQIPIPNGTAHTSTPNVLNQLIDRTLIVNGVLVESQPLIYDLNGNMMADDANRQYEWDAANRLVAINYIDSNNRTEFAYDGLGRRVRITEYGPGVTATVQPKTETYVSFSTAEFTLPLGNYALKFEGLNPNGGDNLALIDAVMLNETLVANGGFENPAMEEDTIAPVDSDWNYFGLAGIASANGDIMSGGPPAPEGEQGAFVMNNSSLWQFGSVTPGSYALSFQAAQRASGNDSYQQVRVTLRGATSTKTFVWSGNAIAEERDGTGSTVTKRFFAEGEQRIGGKDEGLYYYSRDHLGSIREVTNENGELVAQYDYDAWGKSVVVTGNMSVDFGFTGHYFHQPSGMNLALYRAYSPLLGRWISRDPIGERAGTNLYAYVFNETTSVVDPLGLDAIALLASRAVKRQGHIALLIGNNSTGWTYYSRNGYDKWPWQGGNGDIVVRTYNTYEDFKNDADEAGRYDQAYHIHTTLDEDLAMTTYGDAHAREKYHSIVPPSNNCADLTEEVLEAGGHRINGNNQYPFTINGIYIGSPEVPRLLFRNLLNSNMGRRWNLSP